MRFKFDREVIIVLKILWLISSCEWKYFLTLSIIARTSDPLGIYSSDSTSLLSSISSISVSSPELISTLLLCNSLAMSWSSK